MTNEQVLELINKGFTADEVRALGWSAEKTEPEPKNDGQGSQPDAPHEEQIEPVKEINTDFMDAIKEMKSTVDNLTKSVKAIQENNQKNATIPDSDTRPKSADEVIKGFIENM